MEEELLAPLPLDEEGGMDVDIDIGPADEDDIAADLGHDANLAEIMTENDLNQIGTELLHAFDSDERSRMDWLETYKKGLSYLGFSFEEREQPFKNASGVFHPILAEAVIRFQSNAIMEIFPAAGPVLTKLYGKETTEKQDQAKRVKEELNYQLTENMPEYRSEKEKLLFRLPLAGSVFKKVYYDQLTERPCAMMIPAEDIVVDYETSDIESAERICHVMRYSKNKVRKLMRAGFYRKITLADPVPYYSEGRMAEDELTGRNPSIEKDTRHVLLEFHVNYNLPRPFDDPNDVADPYIITVEKSSGKVLSIRRNWKENDEKRKAEQYFIHYEYMPGLGFYAFGLIHLLGSIAKASTSILRQLIDAGTLANLPGGLKTKGLRTKGGDEPIQPGEWRDVDVPAGAIRDNLFPLPYKEPSAVLAQLLQALVEEGRRIGSVADIEIGSSQANAPVGTTLALMERSLKVMSAVHARLHASLRRELKLISRIIAEYMPPQYEWDDEQKYSRAQDFDARVDVTPVSDPNAATQAQRIVQLQAVQQMAALNPELYNLKELHRRGLQAIGVKDDEAILPIDRDPPRLDPISENMAVLTSQPIMVYPDQDHSAHLQAHMSMLMDPKIMEMVTRSPQAAKFMGQMEAHMAEHLGLQYRAEIEQQMGAPLPPPGEPIPPEIENEIARRVAVASAKLREQHAKEFLERKYAEAWRDPETVIKEREVAVKEREAELKVQQSNREYLMDIATLAAKQALDLRRIESEEARAGARIGADLVTFGAQLESEERREGLALGLEASDNIRADAREYQKMEQESRERQADREVKRATSSKAK